MQRDELQATGTTSSKVLLDVLAILSGQIRLLKAVDVSGNFIVHRDACFKQNGDFEKHAGAQQPTLIFALATGSSTTGPDCFAISQRLLVN